MMVHFINRLTGGDMWVHEARMDEYRAAGHKPAAEVHPESWQEPEKTTAKRSRKKDAEK